LRTRHPVEVIFEAVPLIDEKEDEDGRYCEDHYNEEIAELGVFLSA
jgi:hypothetical protein